MMLADDDLDVDPKLVRVAKNFGYAPDSRLAVLGILENFYIDDEAVHVFRSCELARRQIADTVDGRAAERFFHALGDCDPLLDTLIRGRDEITARAHPKLTDHRQMSAPQYAQDLALSTAFTAKARDSHQGAITVHAFRCFGRRQEDVAVNAFGRRRVGHQKSEAVTMQREPAGYVLGIGAGRDKVSGAQLDQQSFVGQPVESIFEALAALPLQGKFAHQLLECCPGVRQPANVFQQAPIIEASGPVGMTSALSLRMFPH